MLAGIKDMTMTLIFTYVWRSVNRFLPSLRWRVNSFHNFIWIDFICCGRPDLMHSRCQDRAVRLLLPPPPQCSPDCMTLCGLDLDPLLWGKWFQGAAGVNAAIPYLLTPKCISTGALYPRFWQWVLSLNFQSCLEPCGPDPAHGLYVWHPCPKELMRQNTVVYLHSSTSQARIKVFALFLRHSVTLK